MTDNELLLAMSEMMDKKLASNLKPIENRLDRMDDRLDRVETRLENVETRLENVEVRLENVEMRLENVEVRLDSVENKVTTISLTLENDIRPRLSTIEACYTGTYDRYKDNADKMDAAFSDIDLLKKVVNEHSEKIQKIG